MNIFIYKSNSDRIDSVPYEVVETKGKGHPDNISDAIAEKISASYSKYCLDKFGVVPRHMVDKLTVLGGGSVVSFGKGEMKNPIRILVNGRFTGAVGGQEVDYMSIVEKSIKDYMGELFPLLDTHKHLLIINNTHTNEGPGVVYDTKGTTANDRHKFFHDETQGDKSRHSNQLRTNDTSTTVSYFPLSRIETLVIDIEYQLNSKKYHDQNPHVGSDIKVMGIRKDNNIEITTCVPLIAKYTVSRTDYTEKLEKIRSYIQSIAKEHFPDKDISIFLNTRDNPLKDDLYLTAIGSAIESGDEGAVGRGNRSRGVIPFSRNFSMEAPSGKNPIYHTGKLFTAIGDIISERIYNETGLENTVFMTSKMGGYISDPWSVAIELKGSIDDTTEEKVRQITSEEVANHSNTSLKIINGEVRVNNY
jgi:S-adenosylmethionine synthetase